jgi:hypothetical protein
MWLVLVSCRIRIWLVEVFLFFIPNPPYLQVMLAVYYDSYKSQPDADEHFVIYKKKETK